MAIKHFIRFAVLFLILAAVSGFAQTQQFTATTNVYDPPYGMVAQLWNNSTHTIYLDHIDVAAGAESTQTVIDGVFRFGIGFSYLEENQCSPVSMVLLDPVNGPQVSTDTTVRVSQQPCTPNGLPYGTLLGPNRWNYTPTNLAPSGTPQLPNLATCNGLMCTLDYPAGLAIPPNHGVTIYTAYYKGTYAFAWSGYAAVNFRGRK